MVAESSPNGSIRKKSSNIHVTIISAAEKEGAELYAGSGRRLKEERPGEGSYIQKEGAAFMSKLQYLIWRMTSDRVYLQFENLSS